MLGRGSRKQAVEEGTDVAAARSSACTDDAVKGVLAVFFHSSRSPFAHSRHNSRRCHGRHAPYVIDDETEVA